MTARAEIKQISVDGKICDLEKSPQFKNIIQKNKLIIVEGLDDLYFINFYLKFLHMEDIEVRYIGGKIEFKNLSLNLKIFHNFSIVSSFALISDADEITAQEEFVRLNAVVNEINTNDPVSEINLIFPSDIDSVSNGTPKIGVFIFPNNLDKGRIEDLFLSCVNDKPGMQCVNPFIECVFNLEITPRIPSKAKALAYLATQEETRRGVGGAAQIGIWEFNSEELNEATPRAKARGFGPLA